jgi:site-specific recombinase XerC
MQGIRDRTIALLPLYAGTRIAEIAALDAADVRLSARKGEVHLVGKGEKSRTVPVHQSCARRWRHGSLSVV